MKLDDEFEHWPFELGVTFHGWRLDIRFDLHNVASPFFQHYRSHWYDDEETLSDHTVIVGPLEVALYHDITRKWWNDFRIWAGRA